MYKPLQMGAAQTRNAKDPPLNHPSKYKPPPGGGGLVLTRLAQSILRRKFPSVDKPFRI